MKKRKGIFKESLFIFGISIVAILLIVPIIKNLKFGLDLQGGFEVLYQVKGVNNEKVTSDMVTSTYKTLLKRIDSLGVSEPSLTIEGEDKIRVQLAGVTDAETARNILSKTANLTFRDTSDNLLATSEVLKSGGAKVGTDGSLKPAVSLGISDVDGFYKMTKQVSEMQDNRIVIWLDFDEATDSFANEQNNCGSLSSSRCISVASVSQGFSSDVIIQGNFTEEEVENLVDLINSGSLPTKLEEISSKTVEASFGQNSLNKTFIAGIIGIGLIMIFMIILYHFAGIISNIGILIYIFFTLGLFWLVGGVLTLPGIAAMVIGIGMAVDASIISFSRIKDELKDGTKLPMAYKRGNENSFKAILDSNLTTLLAAIILFVFGESSVKGFATMLIISTIVAMFVMVFVTRWLLNSFINSNYFNEKLNMFINYKDKKKDSWYQKIDFIKYRNYAFLITGVIIAAGAFTTIKSGLKLGIDFKGGSSISINGNDKLSIDNLKKDIKDFNYELVDITNINDNTYSIRISDTLSKNEVLTLENYFSDTYEAKTDIGVVSNIVKKELVKNAIISLILASIGIIAFVSLRFKLSYAIGGIIALLSDVFVTIALFSIFNLEISSIFIAAILSIIGYSINDSIVTFDRIRENLKDKSVNKLKNEQQLKDIVNKSLKDVLLRSIYTTISTLLPVISLIIFGSHEINTFNIALLAGLVSGVYSSIFIASQIWYMIEKRNIGKPIGKKWYESDEKEEMKVKGINS